MSEGDIVKYQGMRGQVYAVCVDKPYVKVIAFPQDVNWHQALKFQAWPIADCLPSGDKQ